MLILGVLWAFIAIVVISFRFVLLPFGLAVLLAFIIEPLVDLLSSRNFFGRRMPRAAAVIAVYLAILTVAALFSTWAVGQIGREVAKVGAITANVLSQVEPMTERVLARIVQFTADNNIPVSREEIDAFFRQNVNAFAEELGHNTAKLFAVGREVVGGTFRAIFGLFLVLMLTAFLSMDRDRIERFFYTLVPPEYQNAYKTVTRGMSVGLAGVVRGQVMICVTNGILTFIGLWLLGVKLPLLLATIATVFSLIPIFGSILSTIPIVAIALTDSFTKGIFALLWIIGIHLVEANLLNPKIMGDAARIHPVIVVFALIVGEQTSGLIGALFAVPIASVVLTIFKFMHVRAIENVREAVAEGRIEAGTGDITRTSGDLVKISGDLPAISPTPLPRTTSKPIEPVADLPSTPIGD
jgi:putative heme transporter